MTSIGNRAIEAARSALESYMLETVTHEQAGVAFDAIISVLMEPSDNMVRHIDVEMYVPASVAREIWTAMLTQAKDG